MLPRFASFRDFGNTSSTSSWYTRSFIESTQSVKKVESFLQVGVGGGIKSGVAYWHALRNIKDIHPAGRTGNGIPITEADLPQPLTKTYQSIFDMPSTRTAWQAQLVAATNAAPRATLVRRGSFLLEVTAAAVADAINLTSGKCSSRSSKGRGVPHQPVPDANVRLVPAME